jgi:hypothetical protein
MLSLPKIKHGTKETAKLPASSAEKVIKEYNYN